jgi:hypothetical protein
LEGKGMEERLSITGLEGGKKRKHSKQNIEGGFY